MVHSKVLFKIPRAFAPSSVHPNTSVVDERLQSLQSNHLGPGPPFVPQSATHRESIGVRQSKNSSSSVNSGYGEDLYCNDGYSIGKTEVLAFNTMVGDQVETQVTNNLRSTMGIRRASFRTNFQKIEATKHSESSSKVAYIQPSGDSEGPMTNFRDLKSFEHNDFGCSTDNVIRKICINLSAWMWFERLVIFTTVVHSSLVIIDAGHEFPIYVDIGFAAFFTFESIVHIVALGFMNGPRSYIHSSIFNRISFGVTLWNWAEVKNSIIFGLLDADETINGMVDRSGFESLA